MTEVQWTLELPLRDLESTRRLARSLAGALRAGDLLVLAGGLGAGKTTLTQTLGEAMGVEGRISSPTFVLARVHRSTVQGPDLVHVDAYRTDVEGLESLDLPSTASGSVTVVEWGRGLVETALAGEGASWLDLELLSPGLSAGRDCGQDVTAQDVTGQASAGPRSSPAEGAAAAPDLMITDFSESEEYLLGSPRRAVLRGYGSRWAEPPHL